MTWAAVESTGVMEIGPEAGTEGSPGLAREEVKEPARLLRPARRLRRSLIADGPPASEAWSDGLKSSGGCEQDHSAVSAVGVPSRMSCADMWKATEVILNGNAVLCWATIMTVQELPV